MKIIYGTNNRKSVCLSVPCYFLAPCNKRKHTAHPHQQAANHASTDSACRHPVWLPHSSLGFQCHAGRRNYRLTAQATIAQSTKVSFNGIFYHLNLLDAIRHITDDNFSFTKTAFCLQHSPTAVSLSTDTEFE